MTPDRVLLGLGYALGIPGTLALLRIAWRRWTWAFVALEAGVAMIVAGFALQGNRIGAWVNAGWGVGFLATWIAVGRVRRHRLGLAAGSGRARMADPAE